MTQQDGDLSDLVCDSSSEHSTESGTTELAVGSQEKPQELKDKQQEQEQQRRLGKTPSSRDLPQLDWVVIDKTTLVVQFADKLLTRQVPPDSPVMLDSSMEAVGIGAATKPAEKSENAAPRQAEKGPETPAAKPEPKPSEVLPAGEHKNADGSMVTVDANHRVTRMVTATGVSYNINYDQDGHVKAVKQTGGANPGEWSTTDGTHWAKIVNGKPTGDTWEGKINVTPDGKYQYTDHNGITTSRHPGGGEVTTDKSGHVIHLVDANGATRDFVWGTVQDQKGNSITTIVDFTDHSGNHWKLKIDEKTGQPIRDEKTGLPVWEGLDPATKQAVQWQGFPNVSLDGFAFSDDKGLHIEQSDGKTVCMHKDGTTTVCGRDGHLEKVITAPPERKETSIEWKNNHIDKIVYPDHSERKFHYGSDGKLTGVTEPPDKDGKVVKWSTADGINWSSDHGKTWKGTIEVLPDGTYKYTDDGGTVTLKTTDGSSETKHSFDRSITRINADGSQGFTSAAVDHNKIERVAEALRKESGAESWKGKALTHTDRDKVFNTLKDLNDDERQVLLERYKRKYAISLEEEYKFLDGSDKDKFENLLHRRKDDKAEFSARTILAALKEEHETFGKGRELCEKDIRDALSTMNADDIGKVLQKHPELRDAIMNDQKVSQATKDACAIYLKGSDRRTDADTLKLADIALEKKDINMFQEAMKNASPEARKKFLEDRGEQKMKDAFEGHWYNVVKYAAFVLPQLAPSVDKFGNTSDVDLKHAQDYARDGKLSAATVISDNTGNFVNSNEAIEQALSNMTDRERTLYGRGKELSRSGQEAKTDDDKNALEYYNKLHTALDKIHWVTKDADMARWEDLIANKGGGIIAKIGAHRGTVYNDTAGDVFKDVENMSKVEWDKLHNLKQGKNADGSEPKTEADKKRNIEEFDKYRQELQKALGGLEWVRITHSDTEKMLALFDKKMEAKDFASSQEVRRSLEQAISDDTHWYKNDRAAMYQSIAHMTKAEQDQYRTDPEFRKKVDAAVEKCFGVGPTNADCPALQAARRMLDNVTHNKPPEDIVSKLAMRTQDKLEDRVAEGALGIGLSGPTLGQSLTFTADAIAGGGNLKDTLSASGNAKPLRDIQEALKSDPDLRRKLLHPKPEEQQFANDFVRYARSSLSNSDYETLVKPLLENGRLPMELQMKLNSGVIANDRDGTLEDMQTLAQDAAKEKEAALQAARESGKPFDEKSFHAPATDELDKILKDKVYQARVLGFLGADDRQVALQVLQNEDKKIHPEDSLRIKLNHVGGSDDIKKVLNELPPDQVDKVRSEYARKYGKDLDNDLMEKLGNDFHEYQQKFRKHGNDAESYADAHDKYDKSRDGLGSKLVESVGNCGTGYALDDVMNQYTREMNDFHKRFRELPPEKQREIQEKLTEALKNFKESKTAAAEYTVSAIIAAVAIGGAAFTGGQSLWLVAIVAGITGAVANVGVKAAVMGGDYDWDPAKVAKDILTGAVEGATAVIGPGEVGALLKIGARAGTVAAEQVAKQLAEQAIKQGGKQILEKGAETLLKDEMKALMRNAIVHGARDFDQKAIAKIAEETVSRELTGAARAEAIKQIEKTIQKQLQDSLAKEARSTLSQLLLETQLNAAGGALGGGAGGFTHGALNWDSTKSVQENLKRIGESTATSAAMGALGATVMTLGIHGLKAGKEHFLAKPKQATDVVVNGKPVEIKNPEVDKTTTIIGKDQFPGHDEIGKNAIALGKDADGRVYLTDMGQTKDGIWVKKEGSNEFVRMKPGETVEIGPHDQVRLGGKEGPELKLKASEASPEIRKKLDDPGAKPVVDAKPDATQTAIRDGQLNPDTARALPKSGSGIDAYVMDLKQPDGTTKKVIFRVDQIDEFGQRITNDKAGYKLNQLLDLNNGFPASEVRTAKVPAPHDAFFHAELDQSFEKYRVVGPDGKPRLNNEGLRVVEKQCGLPENSLSYSEGGKLVQEVKGWAQEAVGEDFGKSVRDLAKQRYGSDGNEAVAKLAKEDPALKKAVEEAMVERILLGDSDMRDGNFRLIRDADGKYRVQNIDLDQGFKNYNRPTGDNFLGKAEIGITRDMSAALSDQPLSAELREKISRFVQRYDTPDGKQELAKLGLKPDQVDAYLARAKNMAETGKFPHVDAPARPAKPSASDGPHSNKDSDQPPSSKKPGTLPREAAEDPQLNWAEIPHEKRLEMVARAERSDLYKVENVDDFVGRAKEITSRWENRSNLTFNFEASHENLVSSYARFESQVQEPLAAALKKLGKPTDEIKNIVGNTEQVRKLLKDEQIKRILSSEEMRKAFPHAGSPEDQLKVIDRLTDARRVFGESQQSMDVLAGERTDQIQKMLDKYAEDHGLPKVTVRLADEAGSAGTYTPGQGLLSINKSDVLAARDPAKLIDTIYHEFAHAEQDSLIIRHLAEKAHVDKFPPAQNDLNVIRAAYEAQIGQPLDEGHLNKVLEGARDQRSPDAFRPLSVTDTARARELIADSQKYPWPGQKVVEWNNNIRVSQSEVTKLTQSPNESLRLLERLGQNNEDSKVLCQRLFGSNTPPDEVRRLIDQLKDPDKTLDTELARSVLINRINENAQVNEALIKDAWQSYFKNPDEQEAWLIGKRAGIAAREGGVPGRDQPAQVVKDLDPHPGRPKRTTIPGLGGGN